MSDFNKDEYLNDLPDMDNLSGQAGPAAGASQESQNNGDSAASATSDSADSAATAANAASSESQENGDAADGATQDGEDTLTPLGQAKKEAAEYLEALQRERAEFINFRNRSQKEQERFRQHGIIDVLTALLPALDVLAFILVIAALVQMVEIILKKVSPALYQALGIFLPLITTNCAVLGVAILVIQKDYNLLESVVYAFSTALGFALALIVFAGIREQQALVRIPKGMQGVAIVMVTAALLSLAFMGFSGVDGGLKSLFGLE